MSTQIFPLIGGRVLRATITDACGAIDYGDATQLVTSGFVQVGVTANYDDGTEIVVRNAAGRRCISRAAEPELINLALTVQLCQVDPALYTALTGYPALYNALGDLPSRRLSTPSTISGSSVPSSPPRRRPTASSPSTTPTLLPRRRRPPAPRAPSTASVPPPSRRCRRRRSPAPPVSHPGRPGNL
jgi:hypothetical protein